MVSGGHNNVFAYHDSSAYHNRRLWLGLVMILSVVIKGISPNGEVINVEEDRDKHEEFVSVCERPITTFCIWEGDKGFEYFKAFIK